LPRGESTPDPRLAITPEELARRDAEVADLFNRLFPVDPETGLIGEPLQALKLTITPEDLAEKDRKAADVLDRLLAPEPSEECEETSD
jgi:hypothetical protein